MSRRSWLPTYDIMHGEIYLWSIDKLEGRSLSYLLRLTIPDTSSLLPRQLLQITKEAMPRMAICYTVSYVLLDNILHIII